MTKEFKTHMAKNGLLHEYHDHQQPFSFYCLATKIRTKTNNNI